MTQLCVLKKEKKATDTILKVKKWIETVHVCGSQHLVW